MRRNGYKYNKQIEKCSKNRQMKGQLFNTMNLYQKESVRVKDQYYIAQEMNYQGARNWLTY